MPLMTKIRENLATFFSIFAGLFVIYIIFDWGMDITGRRHSTRMAEAQEIGKIDGAPILAKDFSDLLKRAEDNQKAQTGNDPDENAQRQLRDQVWNQVVEQTLYDEEVRRFGIHVTDQEIVDWVRGDNPPDFLRQQFVDSTGTFNRQAYDQAIMDPRNKSKMVLLEDALRKQREREKLQSIITASVQVDEADIKQRFIDQNIKYTADCIFFDPNTLIKDDEIKFSDEDLRRYYNDHSDDYKVEASRKLKYVLFEDKASKADTTSVTAEAEDVLKRANAGVDVSDLKNYSDTPVRDTVFVKHGELNPDIEKAVFAAKTGDLIGPMSEPDGIHIIKVLEFRTGKDDYIRASHILIGIENNDSTKALKTAREIMTTIRNGADFGDEAKKFSKDPGSGEQGGDLGWFGKGRMVKPFEEAAFKAKVGQVVGPVRTQFGYHIIKVTARDNREVRIADIHMEIRASSDTKSEITQRAQDFAYLAKQGSFEKEASLSKYAVVETPSFRKDPGVIPGIGVNHPLSKFAFNNKLGSISDPITLTNGSGVFMISEVKEAGIRPFDEVKADVKRRFILEKKNEKLKAMAADLRKSLAPSDSLGKITTTNPRLPVQHLAPFTLDGFIPGIGRDYAFVGGVSAGKVGEVLPPIESTRGIYLVKLLSETRFDTSAYNASRETLRTQMLNEKKNRFFTDWSDQLKKSAEIVDNRDLFYH